MASARQKPLTAAVAEVPGLMLRQKLAEFRLAVPMAKSTNMRLKTTRQRLMRSLRVVYALETHLM